VRLTHLLLRLLAVSLGVGDFRLLKYYRTRGSEWSQLPDLGFYPRFRYEENIGFPSVFQEQFVLTHHYFSVLPQYFH
jgi:hypothetical protein